MSAPPAATGTRGVEPLSGPVSYAEARSLTERGSMQSTVLANVDTMPIMQDGSAMHTILAIDPGKTTGFCLGCAIDYRLWLAPEEAELSLGQMDTMLSNIIWKTGINLHIVYERFEYRNAARAGLDLTPVKMIGVIELWREKFGTMCTFDDQNASQGKGFYTDDKLKGLGIYKKGRKHGRDATRHLMQWATFGAGGRYIDTEAIRLELVELETLIDMYYNHPNRLVLI